MAQRRDEIFSPYPPFHLPERTCKVFTRIYGRFSIHNRGVPVENKASSIVATHVSVPINRCPPRLSVSFTLPFFYLLYFGAHSLVSSFYFRRRGISLWFPGRSAPFFDLFIFSFFSYIFFLFQTALGEARNGKGTSRRYHCRIFAWKTPRRKPLVLSSFDAARARTKLRA